jgi:hypothetical protein
LRATPEIRAKTTDVIRRRYRPSCASAPHRHRPRTSSSACRDPAATLPGAPGALEILLGWQTDSLTPLLTRFGLARADLRHIDRFGRIHDAYALVRTSGIRDRR